MSEVDGTMQQQKKSSSSTEPLLVAAIDFGTTFSGFAFSFLYDYKKEPLKINSHTFIAGARGLMSLKTSTCILFNKKKEFVAFGFEAEDQYADLSIDDEHGDYYYFRRFKMELFGKTGLNRNLMIYDTMGEKQMSAMTVFSESIRYLKDQLLETCKKRVSGVNDTDIRWVITVPAIWDDGAKQFMREASKKAGIDTTRMVIALEPEAASIYCRYLPLENFAGLGSGPQPFKRGSKYMVLDAGGGTIDITIHEIGESGDLRELHRAEGGDWGGTKVDSQFLGLIEDIVGPSVMKAFKLNNMSDYLDIFREFEVKKRTFKPDMGAKITFKVPIVVNDLFKEENGIDIKSGLSAKPKYTGKVTWVGDKLRMESEVAKALFEEACSNNVKELKKLFDISELKDVDTILMVGGFSESVMLQDAVKKNFPQKRVIIPQDPGLAVLKGAVLFGHDMKVISSRRSKFTYGVKTSRAFDSKVHPEKKKYKNSAGKELCDDIFDSHISIGDEVKLGTGGIVQSYKTTKTDQKSIVFSIYACDTKSPSFTTDSGSKLLGTLTVEVNGEGLDRSASVQFVFGGTELEVVGTDKKTGKTAKAFFNFLD